MESNASAAPVPWRRIGLLLALVLGCLLVVLPDAASFHGDERFYTDAAIGMVQTGDYLTPRYPDGALRMEKPILAYWAAAASLRLWGVSLWSARLPFALAGALVVLGTVWLAWRVWHDWRIAELAGYVAASNVALLTLATRATPDILAVACVLLSLVGLARLGFDAAPARAAPWLFYLGLALGIQTKGLLGLAPLAALPVLAAGGADVRRRLRRLLHPPAVVTSALLAVSWYAAMWRLHGTAALQVTAADQVGSRVAFSVAFALRNLVDYLNALVRYALPWSLVVILAWAARPREFAAFVRAHRRECLFLLSVAIVLLVIFTAGNIRRARYMAPAHPALAVLWAALVARAVGASAWQRGAAGTARAFAGMTLAGGLALATVGATVDGRMSLGGVALALLGAAGLARIQAARPDAWWRWTGAAGMLVFSLSAACLHPVLAPAPVSAAAMALRGLDPPPAIVHTAGVTNSSLGQLRLLTGGRIAFREGAAAPALVTAPHAAAFAAAGYRVTPLALTNTPLLRSWLGPRVAARAARAHLNPVEAYYLAQ